MTHDALEARNNHLIGKALMLAVAHDQSKPQDQREIGDTDDMLTLLRDQNNVYALADYFCSVKRKTGLTVDLYEGVPHHKLKAHRENFAAALAECGFREVPDSNYGKSRTRISVSPGQGFH